MLEIGDIAPTFELAADDGSMIKLADYAGQKLLIFFYPKADTPGCTTQACGFRDNYPAIEANGAAVVGISPDSVEALAKWRATQGFPYPLLSDADHQIAEAYGTWGERSMYGNKYMGIIRSHFVVGADGKLEDVQYKISPKNSIKQGVKQLTMDN